MHWTTSLETPLGRLHLQGSAAGLRRLDFDGEAVALPEGDPFGARDRLQRWFHGELGALDELPLDLEGTDFQKRVWQLLRQVPPGQTTTYGALAGRLDPPGVARAVGTAVGANPLAIVIPCHRVLGTGRALTGYAWGLERKRWLLEHEGALQREPEQLGLRL